MKHKLFRLSPPGYELRFESRFFAWGLVLSVLFSTGFLMRFGDARNGLYNYQAGRKTLLPGAVMPDMSELLGGALSGFLILALCMLAMTALRYAYHRQGSKSIYLMRRLPDKWELHRRCIVLPVLGAAACLLAAAAVLLLFYGIYMVATPRECLTPGQWQKLWSVIL